MIINKLEAAKEKNRRASAVYYAVLNYYGDSDDAHDYFFGEDDQRRIHTNDLYIAAEEARKEVQQIDCPDWDLNTKEFDNA